MQDLQVVRRLLFLRHAKAEPGAPDQEDHDRALTERGRADAAAMARHLGQQGYVPSRILCSSARRTRQTIEPVLAALAVPAAYLETLYLAPPGRILALARDADDADAALMIVGHNPGLEQCAALLAREPVKRREQHRHDVMEEKFPTAALAVIDFNIPAWKLLSPGAGKLVDFVRPRDL
jgi:phosphohistidine phosphatase